MDNIITILKNIGLDEKQSKVYLATLELGESTVLPIAKKAGIKRTYCYDILDELKKLGMVDYVEKNNRRKYFAEDPKKIEKKVKTRLSELQAILPDLQAIYNIEGEKPKVRYFEGKEGLIEVYEMNTKAKELLAIGSPKHIYKYLPDYFDKHVAENFKQKMKVRELITRDGVDAPYLKKCINPYQEYRVLPDWVKISTDLMIFENKLAMISYGTQVHAVVIESTAIVKMQKMMFEMLWEASKHPDR